MGALALYIEDEGVPTVHVSLIREHTAAMRTPRALWVPFILGRPLGIPGDAAFQRRVTRAALRLLERPAGPVLEDYPEEAPAPAQEEAEPLACPVSFGRGGDGGLADTVIDEMAQLEVWRDIAVKRRGRTAVGLLDAPLPDIVKHLGAYAKGETPGPLVPDLRNDDVARLACEDVKAFYMEAAAGQPGSRPPEEMQRWFWFDTAAGKLLIALHDALKDSSDKRLKAYATGSLLPRLVQAHGKGG